METAANQYTGPKDPKERFLAHVDKTDSCWIWTGAKCLKGYGYFNMGNKITRRAHKASYLLFKGIIPKGLFVCHECDNPSCVNPDHLWLGTPLDNVHDMLTKGRDNYLHGEAIHTAKITREQVEEIRSSPLHYTELMEQYNLSRSQVYKIRTKYTGGWK